VEAELASLEASLRRDQRRYEEAAVLLDRAALLYEEEGEAEGLARVLIKRADIHQPANRRRKALARNPSGRRDRDKHRSAAASAGRER
jgi:hypothetical protein